MSSHSSLVTSVLNEDCIWCELDSLNNEASDTDLENIDTLPGDVRVELILLVEMTAEHLGGLIHGVLNLDGDTATRLRLLHDLYNVLVNGVLSRRISSTTYIVRLVVDLQRSTAMNR